VVIGIILIWNHLKLGVHRWRTALISALALLVAMSVLLGIAQGVAKREFGYDFTLAYHMSKVEALLKMMHEAQSLPLFLLSMGLLLVAAIALIAGCAWALSRLFRSTQDSAEARRNVGVATLAYCAVAGLLLGMNRPITIELGEQVSEAVHREARIQEEARKIETKMKTVKRMVLGERIRRPTILVFVVESYGQVLFESKKYSDYHGFIARAQEDLEEGGFSTRSTVLTSPVFGGTSWLANATILCRLKVPTEKVYFSLFKTHTRCLPRQFNEAGYESVFAGSNTTEIPDDYASLFPFSTFYSRDDMYYKGPRMSWSYMPDQFVIDIVEHRVLSQPSDKPRFIYYKLSSSHHPWDTIPPYLEDWSKVGDGSIYYDVSPLRYPDNAFIGGKHYNEGYYSSVEYSMRTIVGYLNSMPKDRDVLALVLGDHQPRRPVAIMEDDPWTIPLHVISRDTALLDNFGKLGYREGLDAVADETPLGLSMLAEHLIIALNDMRMVEEQVPMRVDPTEAPAPAVPVSPPSSP